MGTNKRARFGPDNPNWKGGKSVASNGYVLHRVGRQHHLSDVRGYAYEHRVAAEEKLGRRLKDGEIVHHRDGDRANNAYANLEVCANIAEHLFEHRDPQSKRRKPGESNKKVSCACGRGARFKRFDPDGRPRRFVSGHNL